MPRKKQQRGPNVKYSPGTKLTKGNRAKPKPVPSTPKKPGGRRSRRKPTPKGNNWKQVRKVRVRSKANIGTKSTARVTGARKSRGQSTAKVRGAQQKVYRGRRPASKETLKRIDKEVRAAPKPKRPPGKKGGGTRKGHLG